VGTVWAANENFEPPGFFINTEPSIDNSVYPWYVRDLGTNFWRGWNMVYSQLGQSTIKDTVVPAYGYGLYKMSTNASNSYFYIDYRDARIPYSNTPHQGHAVDLWFKYEFNNNSFYYSNSGYFGIFTPISNGEYLRFWEIKETIPSTPSTAELPDYWENSLVVFNDGNDHPRLVWGPYPYEIGIYKYRIYREYGGWHLLASVAADEYTFVDETVFINPPGGIAGTDVYYYVKGVYTENPPDPIETTPTNTVVVSVSGKKIDKQSEIFKNFNKSTFSLSQNYPNPFNPSTTISYATKESGLVTLKVFDIIGNEVASLVNENKQAGKYSVEFNAGNLPSGIYFYKLTAGKFTTAKKLILLK